MKIAFSKNGKSIKFLNEHFSATGGDNEAGQMLRLLANNNPNDTFYIIGRSEFSRLNEYQKSQLFDYNNVIDVWADLPPKSSQEDIAHWIIDFGVKFDASIMMVGQIGNVTIPDRIQQIKEPSLMASVITMTRGYSTPLNMYHNENLDVPVIEICNDPRYVLNQSRDMMFIPKASLSQFNETYQKRFITSYDDQTFRYVDVPLTYNEMEKIFLYKRETSPINLEKRDTLFSIVLNEGDPSRYSMLKQWVLDKIEDVEVIGAWDEKHTSKDKRFVGSMKLDDVHNKFKRVRSTFIIPIKPGWVTSKYIEMIHAGVIPFLHPTYDTQNHTGLGDFFRPRNTNELYERIEKLKDDKVYFDMISTLRELHNLEKYYDGSHLSNIVMKTINPKYIAPTKVAKTNNVNSLEDFFA